MRERGDRCLGPGILSPGKTRAPRSPTLSRMRCRRGVFAIAALVLAAMLPAQTRAPFTGTLRDESGTPIAAATVTCVFTPDFATLGEPDRVLATTDAQGRFRADLVVGEAYMVWAIGPADADRQCAIARPCREGAAGKTLELVADARWVPTKLQITGSAPWTKDGPLALRFLTADCTALGPDITFPGDGTIGLPTLPTAQVSVLLLDGRKQPLASLPLDLDATAKIALPPPREVVLEAVDPDGKPLAGVQIWRTVFPGRVEAGPIPGACYPGLPWPQCLIAVTGADGTAPARLPESQSGLMHAHLARHTDSISGLADADGVHRIHDGNQAEDEGPIRFVLQPAEPTTLRVRGVDTGRLQVVFRSGFPFRYANRAGLLPLAFPAAPRDGVFACDGPSAASGAGARVQLAATSPLPRRIVAMPFATGTELPELDLAKLRPFPLTVVDADGRPVPCAHVGVTTHTQGFPVYWHDRFVTDGEGRAELLIDDKCDWDVYVSTGTAHGVQVVGQDDPAAPLRTALEPLARCAFAIVDEAGRPVRGARMEFAGFSFGGRATDEAGKALDRIASDVNPLATRLLRSNAAGELQVRFADRDGLVMRFTVRLGNRTSAEFTLRAGEQPQRIVLP